MASSLLIIFVVSFGVVIPRTHCLDGISGGILPKPMLSSAAVYDGENSVYIIGGRVRDGFGYEPTTDIFKYNLTSQTVELVGQLPIARNSGNAALDAHGGFFYFGGWIPGYRTQLVTKFTAQEPNAIDVGDIHSEQDFPGFAFDQSTGSAYFFGNREHGYIIEYNTNTNTAKVVGRIHTFDAAVAWMGDSAFIFGGGKHAAAKKQIYQFTPSTGNVTFRGELPYGLRTATALAAEKYVYIFGGVTDAGPHTQLLKVNTETIEVEELTLEGFPNGTGEPSAAVYIEKLNRIYTFGGMISNEVIDSILYTQL